MSASRARRVLASLAVVGLTLGAAGCSSGGGDAETAATSSPPVTFEFTGDAAMVERAPIPAQVIADQIAAFQQVPGAVTAALGDVPDLMQAGTDQPQPVIVADLLDTEIKVRLIEDELAERGIAPTPEQLEIAGRNLRAAFGPNLDKLPPAYVETMTQRYAKYIALDVALNPEPPEEELRAAYAAEPQKWERSCARHILVTSEEDAQSVLAQLRAGADFAAVATERSLDRGTAAQGGDLGCLPRGETTGAFEEAVWSGPVGEVQGPVTSEVGIHVLLVSSRGVPPYEQVRDDIVLDKRETVFTRLGAWVTVRATRAEVSVDPRFGTWNPTIGKVEPVGGPTPGLSLTPSPGGAPGTSR